MVEQFRQLKEEVQENLLTSILPAWTRAIDFKNGGFVGRVDGQNKMYFDAPKGGVLNARILWTYSAAYRILKDPQLLDLATRAKTYLVDHFIDNQHGGIYWMLDSQGQPVDTKKQIYALGFAIYGLSEYCRATGDEQALELAIDIFKSIEHHSFDPVNGGYFEAFARDWTELSDMRLSAKDANEKKTMNTHLHILEPYTNLYRVWKNPALEVQIRRLIRTFLDKILDPNDYHLKLFFDEQWNSKYDIVSYGHDIEASWLIHEAAVELGDAPLLEEVEQVIIKVADAAAEGIQNDGSMIYELDRANSHIDADRHWWVQAEAVVGYLNAYEVSGNKEYFAKARHTWDYIASSLVDEQNGEWFWSIYSDGTPNKSDDKVGIWKCPYHNSRMCFEIIERFKKYEANQGKI